MKSSSITEFNGDSARLPQSCVWDAEHPIHMIAESIVFFIWMKHREGLWNVVPHPFPVLHPNEIEV